MKLTLILLGISCAFTYVLVWSLCRAAAYGDAMHERYLAELARERRHEQDFALWATEPTVTPDRKESR